MEMTLEESIQFFEKDDYVSKEFQQNYKNHLCLIERHVHDNHHGLSNSDFVRLVNVITNSSFKKSFKKTNFNRNDVPKSTASFDRTLLGVLKTYSTSLISCLIPRESPSVEAVKELMIWALTNRCRLDEKYGLEPLLRWFNCILQYEIVPTKNLQCLYELFFHALDLGSVISLVLDILFKLTGHNKDLVTPWRIKRLLQLRENIEITQHSKNVQLENLLIRLKDLRPNNVTLRFQKRLKQIKIKSYNSVIEKTFAAIWSQAFVNEDRPEINKPLEIFEAVKVTDYSNKNVKHSLIPPLIEKSEEPKTKRSRAETKKISFYECKTIGDLARYLTKLKSPCQVMSLLGSRHMFCLITLNPDTIEIQERLSITLYYTLHNEFLSISSPRGVSKRNLDLLCRINQLQDFFQQGLPVVGRFLAEYLTMWNGEDYFVEICKMLVYLPLTDFIELEECILNPIRILYNSKFSEVHQLVVLNYLSRLATHWATIEMQHYKDFMETRTYDQKRRNLPILDDSCENPLSSLAQLVDMISELARNGLCQIIRKDIRPEQHRIQMNIYLHESTSVLLTLSRCFISKEIPIRPKLPPGFIYFSIFGRNPVCLSRALEYLAMVRHELIPVCQRMSEKLDVRGQSVALEQIEDLAELNIVAKDTYAVLATEKFLTRGESIFRQEWSLDEEKIRQGLTITSHPALMCFIRKFHRATGENPYLCEEGSTVYNDYIKTLPYIFGSFMETFRSKVVRTAEPEMSNSPDTVEFDQDESEMCTATSGYSSIKSK